MTFICFRCCSLTLVSGIEWPSRVADYRDNMAKQTQVNLCRRLRPDGAVMSARCVSSLGDTGPESGRLKAVWPYQPEEEMMKKAFPGLFALFCRAAQRL